MKSRQTRTPVLRTQPGSDPSIINLGGFTEDVPPFPADHPQATMDGEFKGV